MKKGLLSKKGLLLCFVLLLTLAIIGCSSNEATQDGGETQNDSTENEETSEEAEAPQIHFYQNTGIMGVRPEGSTSSELERIHQHLLDQTGIDVNVIVPPTGAEEERLNLMLGSDDDLDVFGGDWQNYYDQGVIIPLNDLLETHGQDILEAWDDEDWGTRTDAEGNIWAVPRNGSTASYPIYVRQDWLDQLGLDMPETIDDLEQVLQAFREEDPNESGEEDAVLMTDLGGLRMSLLGGFTEHGDSNWLDSADNMIKPVELHPGFRDFLTLMADWYQQGYIYREAFTDYDRLELVSTNRVGVAATWHSSINMNQPIAQSSFPEMDYQVAVLTGPEGLAQTVNPGGAGGLMITSKSENPQAVMQYINWEYSDLDNHLSAEHGILGEDWDWVDDTYIEKYNDEYVGEFVMTQSTYHATQYGVEDPGLKMHLDYIHQSADLSVAKLQFDSDIMYNQNDIVQNVPNHSDLDRLKEEEVVRFITGARPMDEFDDFIDQLYSAGLDAWIEEHTRQYNEYN